MTWVIESDQHWRVSKSGYSIKQGFMDDVKIVRRYEGRIGDYVAFQAWLDEAEKLCDEHNAKLGAADDARDGVVR
ncbi:MAG: hypothetical protein FGM36_15270 [Burkholderiaceae bacterium]|nr:hypothetical protein [Burkholderiaceae bacterium]